MTALWQNGSLPHNDAAEAPDWPKFWQCIRFGGNEAIEFLSIDMGMATWGVVSNYYAILAMRVALTATKVRNGVHLVKDPSPFDITKICRSMIVKFCNGCTTGVHADLDNLASSRSDWLGVRSLVEIVHFPTVFATLINRKTEKSFGGPP